MFKKLFPRNEGSLDRVIRLILGFVLIPVGLWVLTGVEGSVVGIVVAAVGLIPLVTGAIGGCPTYTLFGFSTVRAPHHIALTEHTPRERVLT